MKELKTSVNNLFPNIINWKPDTICVESRYPDEAQSMIERKPYFNSYEKLYSSFHNKGYEIGIGVRNSLKLNSGEIEKEIENLLEQDLSKKKREKLIKLYLADFDRINAYYEWFKSDDNFKKSNSLENKITSLFKSYEQSNDELFVFAIPLAKKLKIKRICSMDSHIDATKVMSKSNMELLEKLSKNPKRLRFSKSKISQKAKSLKSKYSLSNDIFSLLKFYNSQEWITHSDTQWDWERESTDIIARVHYTGWELRNKRMANNILEATHRLDSQRALVIVGASHIHPLKKELGTTDTVKLVNFESVFK